MRLALQRLCLAFLLLLNAWFAFVNIHGRPEILESLSAALQQIPLQQTMYGPSYFAMCLLAKNEHRHIREWIVHHYSIGVRRFYVFDDNSSPPMQALLQDFINLGLVDYELLLETLKPKDQSIYQYHMLAVYERCLEKASGNGHTFAGFIDADEYLFLRNASDTVDSLLRDFEPYGGLVVNWRMFGSSGLQKHPPEGTLRGFTACAPPGHLQNTHIKSFVNLQHARVGEVHHFRYQHGKYAVNTAYQRVDGPFSSPAVFDRAVLHHYVIRSQEDFETKRKRGLPAGFDDPRGMDFFNSINVYTLDTCLEGVRAGERLFATYSKWLGEEGGGDAGGKGAARRLKRQLGAV